MSAAVREYLLAVVAVALLSGILLALTPKGAVHRTLTFLCGLAMILTALGPVAKLDVEVLAQAIAQARIQAEAAAGEVTTDNTALMADIITEEAEAYIWDKADGLGIAPTEVSVSVSTEGAYPYPERVTIAAACTAAQQSELTRLLEQELAVPAERQEWHRYEVE